MDFTQCMTKVCSIVPQRYMLAFFGFMAVVNAYTMRTAMAMTIMRMSATEKDQVFATSVGEFGTKTFKFNEKTQGCILSSFYVGYLIMHVPGGLLAEKFGGKLVLFASILSTSILSVLTPTAAYYGELGGLIACRILVGIGQGSLFPALSVLISSWVPLKERGMLGALVFGGGQMGSAIGTYFTGMILDNWKETWSPPFYTFAVLGVLWCGFFYALCANDPASHPYITENELLYLNAELGRLEIKHNLPTPWCDMIRSKPLYAMIFAQIGRDWSFYLVNSDLPKYFNDVIGMDITQNGLCLAIPYLVMWVISLLSGWLCDKLIEKGSIGVTNARKLFTVVAAIGPALLMVSASYAERNEPLVVAYFTIAMGFMGLYYPGLKINPVDVAPNYAGTTMAIVNGMGSISGILVPLAVGVINSEKTITSWRWIFWSGLIILCASALIYLFWASAELQHWNTPVSPDPRMKKFCDWICSRKPPPPPRQTKNG